MLKMNRKEMPAHLLKFFKPEHTIKPKDNLLIPERLGLALQADGWFVRSVIIWHKTAPMPESRHRPPDQRTRARVPAEQAREVLLRCGSVKEPSVYPLDDRKSRSSEEQKRWHRARRRRAFVADQRPMHRRNQRNVWTLGPDPSPEAHFATFPREIPRRAILAGTSEHGVCAACGAPWERVVERVRDAIKRSAKRREWLSHRGQRYLGAQDGAKLGRS